MPISSRDPLPSSFQEEIARKKINTNGLLRWHRKNVCNLGTRLRIKTDLFAVISVSGIELKTI